jgi:hypothetical protein
MSSKKSRLISICFATLMLVINQAHGYTIGGFDYYRAHDYNIENGSYTSGMRNSIQMNIQGVTFSSTSTLTTTYLRSR